MAKESIPRINQPAPHNVPDLSEDDRRMLATFANLFRQPIVGQGGFERVATPDEQLAVNEHHRLRAELKTNFEKS